MTTLGMCDVTLSLRFWLMSNVRLCHVARLGLARLGLRLGLWWDVDDVAHSILHDTSTQTSVSVTVHGHVQ